MEVGAPQIVQAPPRRGQETRDVAGQQECNRRTQQPNRRIWIHVENEPLWRSGKGQNLKCAKDISIDK